MIVDLNESSSYEFLQELFVDKETKELIKRWKTSNDIGRKEFKSSSITDKEYMDLKEVFKVLHTEVKNYDKYKKAFDALCKAAHIVPNGTIIIKYELSKGAEDDQNNLYVKYAENTRPITLPAGTKLYHQSPVGGIKELKPKWKLRGKDENGYLCDKPRVYLTMSKNLPRISTDNKFGARLHSYEVLKTPTKVFVDPLLPDTVQKAVYIETKNPIPVKEYDNRNVVEKISDKITGNTDYAVKESDEMIVDLNNNAEVVNEAATEEVEAVNEVFGLSKKEREEKAANKQKLSELEMSYDRKFNAFCLKVSSYDRDKLQSMLSKKSEDLSDAKQEKKNASDRQGRLEAQLKIDYLTNVCNKCAQLIKKKK